MTRWGRERDGSYEDGRERVKGREEGREGGRREDIRELVSGEIMM